jgi:hypothetical protein
VLQKLSEPQSAKAVHMIREVIIPGSGYAIVHSFQMSTACDIPHLTLALCLTRQGSIIEIEKRLPHTS